MADLRYLKAMIERTRRRVLAVDDHEDARELLRFALIPRDFHVRTAHDADSALAVAEEFRPEIGILNIGLPTVSGYELAARMRKTAGSAEMFLIALTGYAHRDDKVRAIEAGFDLHMTKPVSLEQLFEALDRHARVEGSRDIDRRAR